MPVTGAVMSRSQRLKTAQRGPSIYSFEVTTGRPFEMNGTNRAMLQVLQTKNRTTEEEVKLSATTGMGYIMGYAGTISAGNLNALTIDSHSGSRFVIDTSSTSGITAGDTIFEVGDYIQPDNSRYTYQVRTAVFGSDITLGLVNVDVHRNIFPSTSDGGNNIDGRGLNVANNCTFHVKCMKMPSYTLLPGKLFSFDSGFTFVEVIL